jgi:hypothetical protein
MSANTLFGDSTVVLGIETSCDETAAAVVMGGNDVLSQHRLICMPGMAVWCQRLRAVLMWRQ